MNSFKNCKQLFKYYITSQKQNEINNELKRLKIEQQAIVQNTKFDNEKNESNAYKQNKLLSYISKEQEHRNSLNYKLMQILGRRNREWIFVSQKRMIFICWRIAVKQQKAFLVCVKNVLEKSMYMKGLCYIKNASVNLKRDSFIHQNLRRFVFKQQKSNFQECFSKWKLFSYSNISRATGIVQNKLYEVDGEFQNLVKNVKSTNATRVLTLLSEINKSNLFQAFKNVIKYQKMQRLKTIEFKKRQQKMRKLITIQWWHYNNQIILSQKTRQKLLIKKINKMQLRTYFQALKIQFNTNYDFSNSLSSLEKFMRDKILGDSFKTIKTYQITKGLSKSQDKYISTNDFLRAIRQKHFKGLRYSFQAWKNYSFGIKQQGNKKLKQLWGKINSIRLRDAFQWWARKNNKLNIVLENQQEGPVRCQEWEIQKEINNLKQFMRDERFTETEIQTINEKIIEKNNYLLKKYALRWQLKTNPDKKYLAYTWERLRSFALFRKYLRYQFRICYNKSQNVQNDLQFAFIKWKKSHEFLKKELSKFKVQTLVEFALKTTNKLEKLCNTIMNNQEISCHLLVQRDEFLKYYIKSQVLAMALIKDRERFVIMQAWSRWNQKNFYLLCNSIQKRQKEADLLKSQLQARKNELSESNIYFKSENKELSEFTDDQKIVLQNYKILQDKKKQSLEQLDETEDDFQELLKENERLKAAVEEAEQARKNQKNKKFINNFAIKDKNIEDPRGQGIETSEQRKRREQKERFQKLIDLQKGYSIR